MLIVMKMFGNEKIVFHAEKKMLNSRCVLFFYASKNACKCALPNDRIP